MSTENVTQSQIVDYARRMGMPLHTLNINPHTGEMAQNMAWATGEPVGDFASGVLEAPTRLMAGSDEWWRNVLTMSSMYGLAVRNAGNKGLHGDAFWNHADDLIADPTKEMIEHSEDSRRALQFLDKPSDFARGLLNWQHSDYLPVRILGRLVSPFVRTPDAILRTAFRRMGGVTERVNARQFAEGGAERDHMLTRMAIAPMIMGGIALKTLDGDITGAGPSDPNQREVWESSGNQPYSVRIGDNWYSYQSLDPIATPLAMVSGITESLSNQNRPLGDKEEKDISDRILGAGLAMVAGMTQNQYFSGLSLITQPSDSQGVSSATNTLAGVISSAVPFSGALRFMAQSEDPAVRDTTGDGSFQDRVIGRIASGMPGLTGTLPQKVDSFGRPMERGEVVGPDAFTRIRSRSATESDPAILEIRRLNDSRTQSDKLLMSPPNRRISGRYLTASEYQEYRRISSQYIMQELSQAVQTPAWQTATDEQKRDYLAHPRTGLIDRVRRQAREYLFGNNRDDDDENNIINNAEAVSSGAVESGNN